MFLAVLVVSRGLLWFKYMESVLDIRAIFARILQLLAALLTEAVCLHGVGTEIWDLSILQVMSLVEVSIYTSLLSQFPIAHLSLTASCPSQPKSWQP